MHPEFRATAIRRFFTGLTEYAFHARLGVADPPLVDYIAELLVRFVRSDSLFVALVRLISVKRPEAQQHRVVVFCQILPEILSTKLQSSRRLAFHDLANRAAQCENRSGKAVAKLNRIDHEHRQ